MGKLLQAICRTLLILWIMIAMLSLVWGVMFRDIGSFGLAGLIFVWIYFWETDESNDYKFTKIKQQEV